MPMNIVDGDRVYTLQPPQNVDYKVNNPLARLIALFQQVELCCERESYLGTSIQYLLPYDYLELYGPADAQWAEADPRKEDNKEDFQKQNIHDFRCADTWIARGWATTASDANPAANAWTGPFLFLSYRGGPDSKLSQAASHQLGDRINLQLNLIGKNSAPVTLAVPYNPESDRYEIEIWGYPGGDLRNQLGPKGQAAMDRGNLIVNSALVQGQFSDFAREGLDGRDMRTVAPSNTMHPVLPLAMDVLWTDSSGNSKDGATGGGPHRYVFNMILRGWDNFLKVGVSEAPHGGFGFLHYRNVLSNYFDFRNSGELGRDVEPWMFDANGVKPAAEQHEKFLAVEYMDIHLLKSDCGIGIHRHRDNQEIFFLLNGAALMVMGDWCKMPDRERAFEIRTMTGGNFSLLKAGCLHALYNVTDLDISLLMFGGYD